MGAALASLEVPSTITVGKDLYTTAPLIAGDRIQATVADMGADLAERYRERGAVHVITVLKGAQWFAQDLRGAMAGANRALDITSDSIKVASYEGVHSKGEIELEIPPEESVEGKHVLLAEDVLDSGKTLQMLLGYFQAQRPASLELAVAVNKQVPTRPANMLGHTVMHTGFDIPNLFVIGYGLDLDQQYRELPDIYALTPVPGDIAL